MGREGLVRFGYVRRVARNAVEIWWQVGLKVAPASMRLSARWVELYHACCIACHRKAGQKAMWDCGKLICTHLIQRSNSHHTTASISG